MNEFLFQYDITRLEHPYATNCTRDWGQTPYGRVTDAFYSLAVRKQRALRFPTKKELKNVAFLQSCQRHCLQEAVAGACDCFHPTLVQSSIDISRTTGGGKRVGPCDITPTEESKEDK